MGFLKKLFGGGEQSPKKYVDKQGVYFYVVCDNCGTRVRVRADKQHDLQNTGSGYEWHKTIVDSRCFRRIQTVVQLDANYQMVNHEISGGRFITEEEYLAAEAAAEQNSLSETTENDNQHETTSDR
ncbi:MAG: hypothetical protein H6656_10900 [Ardenticatenaceae bacterium]|nr:hypothetical protein [Anaerolineales bacterium]MCB9007855.1 hypothetical protein [Ardenticatenaceae bacterium]